VHGKRSSWPIISSAASRNSTPHTVIGSLGSVYICESHNVASAAGSSLTKEFEDDVRCMVPIAGHEAGCSRRQACLSFNPMETCAGVAAGDTTSTATRAEIKPSESDPPYSLVRPLRLLKFMIVARSPNQVGCKSATAIPFELVRAAHRIADVVKRGPVRADPMAACGTSWPRGTSSRRSA
jgi:hypothetical protein